MPARSCALLGAAVPLHLAPRTRCAPECPGPVLPRASIQTQTLPYVTAHGPTSGVALSEQEAADIFVFALWMSMSVLWLPLPAPQLQLRGRNIPHPATL